MTGRLPLVMVTAIAAFSAAATATAKDPLSPGLFVGRIMESDWKPPTQLPPGAEYHLIHEDQNTHGIQALVRFPAGFSVGNHSHTSGETLIVIKGKLLVKAGALEKSLHAGDYAFLPAGVPHSLTAQGLWGKTVFVTITDGPYELFAQD